jgi:lysophospholipase L1-like esterase
MFRNSRHPVLFLLLAAILFANNVIGQSLAIHRNRASNSWLEATSPLDIGYRIQTSLDFKTWEDTSDQAAGLLSYRIEATNDVNRFFRLRTWNTQDAPITLVILGDSTVADFAVNNNQFAGWGQGMYGYLKSNVRVVNLALAYQSTKVFLTSIQKEYLVKIKPDFVLVHFGWVDSSDFGETYQTSVADYEANLKKIVQIIRGFKGTPIVMTPSGTRYFDSTGKNIPVMQDRCQAVRNVAVEFQTYLIDLNRLAQNLYNQLGETNSAYITWNDQDRAHFSLKGADVIAGLVVDAFPNILRPQVTNR